MLESKTEKDMKEIFTSWISQGSYTSQDFIDSLNSQQFSFNDIRMIPFLSLNVSISCSGVIGSYEHQLDSIVCLWQSQGLHRSLIISEPTIPTGKMYKFDPTHKSAKTIEQLRSAPAQPAKQSFFASLFSRWSVEELISNEKPQCLYEYGKDPLMAYNTLVKGQKELLTLEYNKKAASKKKSILDVSTIIKTLPEKTKVKVVYIPYCFLTYSYEDIKYPVLINCVSGEILGKKKPSPFTRYGK